MKDQFDLVIDIGNTLTKIARWADGRIGQVDAIPTGDLVLLKRSTSMAGRNWTVFGSVGDLDASSKEYIRSLAPIFEVRGDSAVPFKNAYRTPSTLGADRLANAAGAWSLFHGRSSLVIDIGTCITYDLIDQSGTYLGGAIGPGVSMRANAMHEHSANLPIVIPENDPPLIGDTTTTSLAAGIHHGMVSEISGMIAAYRHQFGDMAVILTGGDALGYARALKSGIFAHPDLTLAGLHAILLHHRDTHGFARDTDTRYRESAGPTG